MKRIDIPKCVTSRPGSREFASIWTNGDVNDFVLAAPGWNDAAAWGLLLVDMARHVAKMYAQNGHDETETLARIRSGFDAEWNHHMDDLEPR